MIENAATWHSYCRWNVERALFSAVVYGDGNRFVNGIRYLKDLFAELGGLRRVLYFGDLDPQGLLIPQEASGRRASRRSPCRRTAPLELSRVAEAWRRTRKSVGGRAAFLNPLRLA